jgi:hypothetical protein
MALVNGIGHLRIVFSHPGLQLVQARERNLGGVSFQILGSGGIIDRSEKVRN